MLRTICWIPVVVAESGHLKDKLVTAIVFIGSFHLRQWSKAVPQSCCCAFHVFSHLEVDTIGQYDYELSVPSKEREREREISLVVMTTKDDEVFTWSWVLHKDSHQAASEDWCLENSSWESSFLLPNIACICAALPQDMWKTSLWKLSPGQSKGFICKRQAVVQEWGSFPACSYGKPASPVPAVCRKGVCSEETSS